MWYFPVPGLPLDLPSYLTPESTTKLVPIVSSSRAAKIICDKWQKNYNYLPDAIVVEGPKAGGHLGFKRTITGSALCFGSFDSGSGNDCIQL